MKSSNTIEEVYTTMVRVNAEVRKTVYDKFKAVVIARHGGEWGHIGKEIERLMEEYTSSYDVSQADI